MKDRGADATAAGSRWFTLILTPSPLPPSPAPECSGGYIFAPRIKKKKSKAFWRATRPPCKGIMSWKRFFGSHSQILLCHGHLSHAAAERDSVVLTLVLSDPASTEGRQRHRSKRLNGNHRRRVRTIVNKKKKSVGGYTEQFQNNGRQWYCGVRQENVRGCHPIYA